ncbi:MAG TPA: AmpG family muropeptide MFS transporter [Candidatus Cybelea sp.]|nr:AmpG family muropeptide MFS transporter [Candidatus Cybelea sp.]
MTNNASESRSAPARLRAAIGVYAEPKVLAVLFLGFSSGLPLGLTGQTLAVWMRESGVSLATIGFFALVGLPYVLKFLWAPAIDAIAIPWLGRRLGRRRAWLVTTQIALMLAIAALGLNDPVAHPLTTAALALVVTFCSASQDIVVDAFRVESLDASRFAAGMADYVAGYRVALLAATAGAFEIAAQFQGAGLPGRGGWSATYAVMAALVLLGTVTTLLSSEPEDRDAARRASEPFRRRLQAAVVEPFVEFSRRPGWLVVLGFVVLFKFGDSMAGIMTAPFVLDLGFDKTEYGRVVKLFGFAATLAGGFAGGSLQRTAGVVRSLWIAGIGQMAANLMFVWLAHQGADTPSLILTIGVENFASGFGTVVFVAYLSGLCRERAYTATQYALLSALAAVGRTVLSAYAGWLAEHVGWSGFFLLAGSAALPGLALLWWLTRRGRLGEAPAV